MLEKSEELTKEETETKNTNEIIIKEEISEKKKKPKLWKKTKTIIFFLIFIGSVFFIIKKSKEVSMLQKKIDDENRKKEEDKLVLSDSKIINEDIEDKETVRRWINPEVSFQTKLLYRLSRDGSSIFKFHQKCDYKGPTLILIESADEEKFGGYSTASWDMFGSMYKNSSKTFLFSLNRNKKYIRKTKFEQTFNGDIFSGSREVGPWFGIHDLYFYGTMNDCYSYKYSGQCAFLDGNGIVDRTDVDNSIRVKEVELYEIIFDQ